MHLARSPLFLALIALGLLLLVLETVRPCFFLHDDNATWFVAAYAHDFRVLTETGRFAEVNYFQYGGEPFLEQGQTAVLYPPIYLGCALAKIIPGDLRWSIEWIATLHLALGLVGFYRWMREAGVARPLAALGGLAWVLNPFVLIVGASWIMVTYVAAWLPWLFWALDRIFARPTFRSALTLGTILSLFFLQGYVQWVVYALLFAGLYAAFLLFTKRESPRIPVLYHLILAALVFLAWAAPLLLPMLHAVAFSAARAEPLSLSQALFYRVQRLDLFSAQIGMFRPFMFGISSVIFFCPPLVLALVFVRFFGLKPETQHRLFPLIVLAVLALLFSSRWHVLLSFLPLLEKFRWPFKVFLFAEFFILAALIVSIAAQSTRRKFFAPVLIAVVIVLQLGVALAHHDDNFFSKTTLPSSVAPLPQGLDPTRGRVIAIDDHLPELDGWRYFTHCHGTYFQVPSLGGYDPLVGREQLRFALGLDFPNVFYPALTPAVRARLEDHAVRYWIVDPVSPRRPEVEALDGLTLLSAEPDRLFYEDSRAQPMVSAANCSSLSLKYAGNSILIPLDHATSPVTVSVGPTDGWWYRLDRGPWVRAESADDRLVIAFGRDDRLLEVSYFDSRFRQGLILTLIAVVSVILMTLLDYRIRLRAKA